MSVEMQERADGNILVVRASGKLSREDYERFLPEVERLVGRHGKIRVFFDMRHFRDIERLAMVGDKAWEHGMAVFCRPFTTAKIRFCDKSQTDQADTWTQSDLPVAKAAGSGAV